MKSIQRVVSGIQPHWVGDGFPVRSLFSYHEGTEFDPFLLLDYAGPHEFPPSNKKRGVDVHPHKGFETVTILYKGELAHRDSSGGSGRLGPGDVQWMTSGNGIVHEEFHSEQFTKQGGTLEMIQLWVNLSANYKSTPPKYQDLRDDQFPRVELERGAGTARVIAGEFAGARGIASTFSPINVWDLKLDAEADVELKVPPGHTTVLIALSGNVTVNEAPIKAIELALFERDGDSINIRTEASSQVLILTGEPLGESVVGQGPFVMNTREEIHEAIRDYQSGKMGQLDQEH